MIFIFFSTFFCAELAAMLALVACVEGDDVVRTKQDDVLP